jgi:hypothetical protein
LSKEEEFLPNDHPLMELNKVVASDFDGGGVFSLFINIYWGVKDIDRSKNSMWDAAYIGEVVFDDTFDFSGEKA